MPRRHPSSTLKRNWNRMISIFTTRPILLARTLKEIESFPSSITSSNFKKFPYTTRSKDASFPTSDFCPKSEPVWIPNWRSIAKIAERTSRRCWRIRGCRRTSILTKASLRVKFARNRSTTVWRRCWILSTFRRCPRRNFWRLMTEQNPGTFLSRESRIWILKRMLKIISLYTMFNYLNRYFDYINQYF